MILFSDGATEATNQQEEMFEEDGLLEALSTTTELEAVSVVDLISKPVNDFTANCEQADDISVVVVQRIEL